MDFLSFSSSSSSLFSSKTSQDAVDAVTLVSKCTIYPDMKTNMANLKLSVSDLPMLSCHYIQKGCLFTRPPVPTDSLVSLIKRALSQTLTLFPPLAGRLFTDSDGHVYITCNDAGAEFLHANASSVAIHDVLAPEHVPEIVEKFFTFDRTVSYKGHFQPLVAVQVTELADGVFIGCVVNHAVTDGTSFWNFFNTFAEVCRAGSRKVTQVPDFSRDSVLVSSVAVLKVPEGGPQVTFDQNQPLSERIFSFSRRAILDLKARTNNNNPKWKENQNGTSNNEIMGKILNDPCLTREDKVGCAIENGVKAVEVEVSSFQSLSALLWRSVTRARKLPPSQITTFRMAVNYRHRLEPKLDSNYFGNAIGSIPTYATAEDVLSHDLRWCAEQLNKNISSYDDATARRCIAEWERNPRFFPLGNFDGASVTMGSSPRFPMYDNDFGWGRPLAVRSGKANKFDGKISAFPAREGGGSVDLEVVLAPETMAAVEADMEFMQYVS